LAFMRNVVRIPTVELLPFRFPLLSLTRFFHLHPTPRPRSLELLSRWVWRGIATGEHRGQDRTYVRATVAALRGVNEEEEVQQLLHLLRGMPVPFTPESTNLRAAETKLLILSLMSLGPRDLRTGELLDVRAVLARFGKRALVSLVPREEQENGGPFSDLAFLIHPPLRRGELARSLSGLLVEPRILASHGLSPDTLAAFARSEWSNVVRLRVSWLLSFARDFLTARSHWEETDRPSIEALIVHDSVS
ncbi:MAG: hypothetical protein OK454_10545, partial [Thaumarchaeota archaeon]|nr:hypothetical protein [Nitrososphaerota archaeon]